MRKAVAVVLLAALAGVCAGAVELLEDKPPVPRPKPGRITGTIAPAGQVARVEALARQDKKTFAPASFDRKTGRFTFANLPGDADYDLRVVTTDGRTVEGIDLSWIDSRMVRLAALRRKQLGLPAERKLPFTMRDVDELLKWVADWKDFMEDKRVLYVEGHGKRATILVELMRTREFYSSAGGLVWRVELWYMKNEYGGWDRLANSELVLHRRRISPDEWRKIDLQYYPELSVHISAEGESTPVHFTLPAKPDPSRGRLRNTDPKMRTKPHIRGLDVKPDTVPPGLTIDP